MIIDFGLPKEYGDLHGPGCFTPKEVVLCQLCQIPDLDEPSIPVAETFALHCGHRFCNSCWTAGVSQAAVRFVTACA